MVHLRIKNGLDIPIKGKPHGEIQQLIPSGQAAAAFYPSTLALDLSPFTGMRLHILVKPGDTVKIGQPLVEDRSCEKRYFVSPAGGVVKEITRGAKRVPLAIVIEPKQPEESYQHERWDFHSASREELIQRLKEGGMFTHIFQRPFDVLADTTKVPRSIFIKAVETAPFMPPAELQVRGHEKEFQAGLDALKKLTDGKVHLVHRAGSPLKAFTEAQHVQIDTVEGPHPAANLSVHIANIDPIFTAEDVVWTVTAHEVVIIGHFLLHGRYFVERVIGIGGPGVLPDRVGYFRVRAGFPVHALLSGRLEQGEQRLISGDPLMGEEVESTGHLGFGHYAFSVIPNEGYRQFLHFFRLGTDKYSFSRAYLSGHLDNSHREYNFTTSLHGEHRPFMDNSLYSKVMPMCIPTMQLVKALMAENYDLAVDYGLLEVAPEDFSLTTFICPSKVEMVEVVRQGLKNYAAQMRP